MRPPQPCSGFTLIEVLVTMAIIAILAASAYPAYTDHILRARRAEAFALLLEQAQRAERHFTLRNTYEGFTLPSGQGLSAHYTFAFDAAANGFLLTATAAGSQQRDTPCTTLTIDHRGARAPRSCW